MITFARPSENVTELLVVVEKFRAARTAQSGEARARLTLEAFKALDKFDGVEAKDVR